MKQKYRVHDLKIRLDKFLALASGVPRSKVQKDISASRVLVNGEPALEPDIVLRFGDEVEYTPTSTHDESQPKDLFIETLYENESLLVLDKPAGISVHPGAGFRGDSITQMLLFRYPELKDVGQPDRPGIVHRLDKDTSGCLVVAKTKEMYTYLLACFAERRIEKEYLVLVYGQVDQRMVLDQSLGKSKKDFRKMTTQDPKIAKSALTEVVPLEHFSITHKKVGGLEFDETSLILVKLHTGRTHQIRVHLSSIGCPVVSDALYGGADSAFMGLKRQFLHARSLRIPMPDKSTLKVESRLPHDLQTVLVKLRSKKLANFR